MILATLAAAPLLRVITATPIPNPGGTTTPSSTAPALSFPSILYSSLIWGTLLFAIIALFMPDRTRDQRGRIQALAIAGSGLALFLSFWAIQTQANQAELGTGGRLGGELVEQHRWLDSFPITADYHLDADGIALPLLVMTTVVFFCVALTGLRNDRRVRLFTVCLLIMETGLAGILLANDWVLFLLFWTLPVAPVYLLTRGWGQAGGRAAGRFAITWLLSAGLLLVAACVITFQGGTHSFDMTKGAAQLPGAAANAGFWLCVVAFLLVMAVVPFHLPLLQIERHGGATLAAVTAAILPGVGAFGFLHVVVAQFPSMVSRYSLLFAVLAVAGALWAGVGALRSDDLRQLVAYLGAAQMAAVLLGSVAGTSVALVGVTLMLVARALVVSLLMLLASSIQDRTRTSRISQLGGLAWQAPRLAGFWIIAALTAAGAPLLAGFGADLLLFTGSFPSHRISAALVLAGVLLSVGALLWTGQRIFYGGIREAYSRVRDLGTLELTYLGLIVALIVIFGLFPNRFAGLISNGASSLLTPGAG